MKVVHGKIRKISMRDFWFPSAMFDWSFPPVQGASPDRDLFWAWTGLEITHRLGLARMEMFNSGMGFLLAQYSPRLTTLWQLSEAGHFLIGSMYGIYGNMDHRSHQYIPNVSIYTIHGSYGFGDVWGVLSFAESLRKYPALWLPLTGCSAAPTCTSEASL